jgi:transposase
MAGQRIDIMDVRQLIQLKIKGWSNRKIAEFMEVSRNTVNTYIQIFSNRAQDLIELLELSDAQLLDFFPQVDRNTDAERYGYLSSRFEYYRSELTKTGATLQTLWHEYQRECPDGYRYTQFVHHYRKWNKKTRSSGILVHRAGAELFIDFAGKKLSYTDMESGKQVPVEVFVAIRPWSQLTYARAIPSQQRDDLVECLVGCLNQLGGVPQAIVSDNLKSVVSKGHKYAPVINKTLKDVALHYNCVVNPARPYHAQDKALVENAVNLVYQRIYYPLNKQTYFSLASLNQAIEERMVAYNDYPFQNRPTTRMQEFVHLEQAALQPLPSTPYQIRYYKRAKVQKISHVYVGADRNYYSVPHRFVGQQVEVQYNATVVEVFFNAERIAHHRRSYRPGHYTTVADHMPSTHQAYNSWNPQWFEKQAERIGPHTRTYISRLMGQYAYPEIGYKQAQGILQLAKHAGHERVERACERANTYHKASYRIVENIITHHLDATEVGTTHQHIPEHSNIRGASQYT